MPTISSYADLILDWEKLLAQCRENGHLLPGYDPDNEPLAEILEETKSLKIAQETLSGHRQATTQDLNEKCDEGREAARRLRSYIRSRLGTRSEHLPAFGIAPIRGQARKSLKPPPPPPVEDAASVESAEPQE